MKASRLPPGGIVLEVMENLPEVIWAKIASGVKNFIKKFIENLLAEEATQRLGAGPYERSSERRGYRYGHYHRILRTNFGLIRDIRVPHLIEGCLEFTVLNRYKRRRWNVDAASCRLFLIGANTRSLKRLAYGLLGRKASARTVSNSLACLNQEIEQYRSKPLTDTVEFLFLNGISKKIREIGILKKVVLCALGVHRQEAGEEQPRMELLSFRLAEAEDTESWRGFLADLHGRGLLGKNLRLIITDGNPELLQASKDTYSFIKVQRCFDHRMRNMTAKVRQVGQTQRLPPKTAKRASNA